MEIYKYLPLASDRMGMLWTLSSIEDICILEFGPAGTTHYAIEGVGSLNGKEKAKIYSTHMDEKDVTFGRYDRLEKAVVELDINIKPKYIFLMTSSISSIIGTDIEGICHMLQDQVEAKLIPVDLPGFKGDYTRGVEQALSLIAKKMVQKTAEKKDTYNILGCTIDQYQFESDSLEIQRMMKQFFHKEVQTIFTAYTSCTAIEKAAQASLNIVIRKEALPMAQYMEEQFGIPYIYHKPYGFKGTCNWIQMIQEVTSWTLDQETYQAEISELKTHMMSIKRKFYHYKSVKACAIFADRDTAFGMSELLEELGLEINHLQIIHESNEKNIKSGYNERERMSYLKDRELYLLLGDGATLKMPHKAREAVQISNPNLDKIILYPYTPYVGFRGVLWMIQLILNIRN